MSYNRGQWELELAIIARAQGQKEKTRAAFEASKKDFTDWLAQKTLTTPRRRAISQSAMRVWEQEEALRAGRKAQELSPRSRDYHSSLQVAKQMAVVYAWTGDHRAALAELQELAPLPDCLTYGELKLHPQWDDFRHEPLLIKVLAVVGKPATID